MNKSFLAFAYAWIIIVGAYMLIFTPEGIIHVCIACGSVLTNIIGAVSVVVGVVGLARLATRSSVSAG